MGITGKNKIKKSRWVFGKHHVHEDKQLHFCKAQWILALPTKARILCLGSS